MIGLTWLDGQNTNIKKAGNKRVIPKRTSLEQFADDSENVEELAIRKVTYETLYKALDKLTKVEYSLVFALFFENKTEREMAVLMGISQPAIHKKKTKILKKLKNILKNRI